MHPSIIRMEVGQEVFDRFNGKQLSWGHWDCAHMCAFVLKRFGFDNPLKGNRYTTLFGARKALKKAGFDTLEAALDGMGLQRIAPAMAVACDIVAWPGKDDWSALGVCVGNGVALGFGEDDVCALGKVELATVAWRVV